MRKEYGKALRRLFEQKIKQNNIPLEEYELPIEHKIRGDRAYKYQNEDPRLLDTLSCFVILVKGKGNEFTVEIGWSKGNRFPAVSSRPSGFLSPNRSEFKHSDFVFRIGDLLKVNDFWWTVEQIPQTVDDIVKSMEKITNENAEAKILPFVEDVIKKLKCYAFPFFEELAAYKLKNGAS